jgi:hypothetical protein
MSNPTESLPIRQSNDGKWEVENVPGHWIICETKKDAYILSRSPIVLNKSYTTKISNKALAAELDKTSDVIERYDMFYACRLFRKRAKLVRGKVF